MRSAIFLLATASLLPALAGAASLDEYLAARKKHGVEAPISQKELKRLTGKHTIEVAGKVVGTIGKDGDLAMLVKVEDVDIYVDVGEAPEWYQYGVTDARMLLSVERAELYTMLEAKLVTSVEESDIAAYEERLRKEEEARKAAEAEAAEMVEEAGNVPVNPLTGSIGSIRAELAPELAALVPDYMSYILQRNKKIAIQDAQRIAESIIASSAQYGVEPRLVVALIQAESNFNPKTTSNKGAQGLGQLMPFTSKALGITDPYNIEQNINGTVRTLRGHLDVQGKKTDDNLTQLKLALAAYNAGPGAVQKYGGVPPYKETEDYIAKVVRTFKALMGIE